MGDSLPWAISLLDLIIFFLFDFMYANVLSKQKLAHPELEECAPAESPDLDTMAVLESLSTTAVEMYQHERERLTGIAAPANAGEYTSLDRPVAAAEGHGASHDIGNDGAPKRTIIHGLVMGCGVAAPILTAFTFLFPSVTSWSRFSVASWLSYAASIPGVAAAGLYAMRSYELRHVQDVTKTEWIAMMWFRIDFMFIMAAVSFFGIGGWAIAACLLTVALYLAHRVLRTEKRLNRIQRHTQLVRGEVDVQRVLVPGSAESKKATGVLDGYNALNPIS